MRCRRSWDLTCFLLLVGNVAMSPQADAGPPPPVSVSEAHIPADLPKRVQDITDTVLKHHMDPPTRQEMVLGGVKGVYRAAGLSVPAGLSRRISGLTTPEQFKALLCDVWPSRPAKNVAPDTLVEALADGLLAPISGGAQLLSAKEHKVQEQIQGNRYVGIHIQLRYDANEKRSVIQGLVPHGPADRAGAKEGDRIEQVDGVDTKGMKIAEVVDRIRGEVGTEVVIRVRQPNSKESRTLKITRGALFVPTIQGLRKQTSGEWEFRLDGADPIGYVRIRDISASTPQELRRIAQQLEEQNMQALIVDLRDVSSTEFHPTVLLADCLMERGRIGQVREADRVMTYDATPDSLFHGWPLVVLVDGGTVASGEWLAAALQDNHRAVLVGNPTGGGRFPGSADRRPIRSSGHPLHCSGR